MLDKACKALEVLSAADPGRILTHTVQIECHYVHEKEEIEYECLTEIRPAECEKNRKEHQSCTEIE